MSYGDSAQRATFAKPTAPAIKPGNVLQSHPFLSSYKWVSHQIKGHKIPLPCLIARDDPHFPAILCPGVPPFQPHCPPLSPRDASRRTTMARGSWLPVLAGGALLVSLSRWVQLDFVGQMQRPSTPKVVRLLGGYGLMGWVEGLKIGTTWFSLMIQHWNLGCPILGVEVQNREWMFVWQPKAIQIGWETRNEGLTSGPWQPTYGYHSKNPFGKGSRWIHDSAGASSHITQHQLISTQKPQQQKCADDLQKKTSSHTPLAVRNQLWLIVVTIVRLIAIDSHPC